MGAVAACAALAVALGACADRGGGGGVQLTTPETVAALDFRGDLPSLPDMVRRWGRGMALEEPVEQWQRSLRMEPGEGSALRRELHRAVAPVLAEALRPSTLEESLGALDRSLRDTEALLRGTGVPAHLRAPLERARQGRDRAAEALAGERVADAAVQILDAADELRGVSPDAVARALVAEAESALGRARATNGGAATASTLRAERLLAGARDAADAGAPVLALRRAWYALRLLDEEAGG